MQTGTSPTEFLTDSACHAAFSRCGKNVKISPGAWIEHPECFEVGDHVVIHRGVTISAKPKIGVIGNASILYPDTTISGSPDRLIIAEKVRFFRGTHIEAGSTPGSGIEVGHDSHFAPYCVLYGGGGLKIGAFCNVSAHVVFATIGHNYHDLTLPMALSAPVKKPITVEDDVWIAANSTICAGVTVARGCVVGANSVLSRSTEPLGLYAGAPARRLRTRGESID